ncbi:alpha-ribazole phosphatase [Clostridium oceanicum]|uniref:Alpha-ribazole phosphatase n=1 Tax=Clostridium oceanicum TaxID=1543 RepID=A0ABP3UNA2_9CLOT
MNIYLLRHGETKENKEKKYYGKLDSRLNSIGINQAKKAGKYLKNIKFSKVYISERERCKETLKIAFENKGNEEFEIIKDARINELDFGEFEGKSYKEIKKSFPKECTQWEDDWKGFTPPKGESAVNFFNRVKSFMKDIEKLDEENILIVTHGGVIKMIYCYMLDRNLDLYWKFSTKNGRVSLIKYEYSNWFIDYIS